MLIDTQARIRAKWKLTVLVLDKIPALNRQQGIDNRLDAKFDAASHALAHVEHYDAEAAIHDLEAFSIAVEAQGGNLIPQASAYELNAWAEELVNTLSGSRADHAVPIAS